MLPATTKAIDRLDRMVGELNRRLPQPKMKNDWFQYSHEDQGPPVVVLTRLVRLVSGLRAAKLLGERGFTQEMGTLLRTIDDFCDEVTFLIEGHGEDSPSTQGQKFVAHFFAEKLPRKDELLERPKAPDRVKREKIRAGQSRLLQPDNPSFIQERVKAIDGAFDGFVHGGYPHVMELYHGREKAFLTNGMADTRNLTAMRNHLLFYVSRSLAVGGFGALAMGFEDLGEEMKKANREFCASSEYPGPEVGEEE